MNAVNTTKPSQRQLFPMLLLVLAAALAGYFVWTRISASPTDTAATQPDAQALGAQPPASGAQPGADGRLYAGQGIEVDASGARVLNEAGLPGSNEPLPVAKSIPIKAAPTEVVGYSKDANGVVKPVRAGELAAVPNSPGNYTVVDMWAEGGPAVVAPTRGTALSARELARLREAENKAERSRR